MNLENTELVDNLNETLKILNESKYFKNLGYQSSILSSNITQLMLTGFFDSTYFTNKELKLDDYNLENFIKFKSLMIVSEYLDHYFSGSIENIYSSIEILNDSLSFNELFRVLDWIYFNEEFNSDFLKALDNIISFKNFFYTIKLNILKNPKDYKNSNFLLFVFSDNGRWNSGWYDLNYKENEFLFKQLKEEDSKISISIFILILELLQNYDESSSEIHNQIIKNIKKDYKNYTQ